MPLRVPSCVCAAVLLSLTSTSLAATVESAAWGNDSAGNPVTLYTLREGQVEVGVTNYGARITSVRVPDRTGKLSNVVLGRDSVQGYEGPLETVMGATIGRYANRIAGGSFKLGENTYTLVKNNGQNTIHGGSEGFNRKVWKAKPVRNGVAMTLLSPDGDMGFPGALNVQVTFTLQAKNGSAALRIDYQARSSAPTVINLTNHTFFNLASDSNTSVLEDRAMIAADTYTPAERGIPTGAIETVQRTPFDFRESHTIASAMPPRGYDNNLVLRSPGLDHLAAEVDDATNGRTLRVYTTEPGLQFFVPHFQVPATTPAGAPRFPAVQAFCLETEHFPDSPNHENFPTTTLEKSKVFRSTTIWVFGLDSALPNRP